MMDSPSRGTLRPIFDELRGERVLVRPFREADAAEHYAAVVESREYLLPWLPWAASYQTEDDSREVINRFIAHWRLRYDFAVGLWDARTERFVGGSGLHPRDTSVPSFEIGYWLRQSAQGHGYITEAVRLLTEYAFSALGANRVFIRCDARNTRSAAVAERLGFVREGRLRRDGIAYDGVIRDTLMYALTPGDPRWPGPGVDQA
jgi:ribosomal-protein-serine acetyltransferase